VRLCEDGDLQPIADAIARAPRPALRRLVLAEYGEPLGDWCGDGEPYGHWGNLGDLSRVWSSVPALNEIVVQGHSMRLGQIELPTVTSVAIRGTLSAVNLRAIASAKWAQVERLEIFFGDPADGADGCVEDIAAVLSGEQLPQLRELGLTYCGFVDQIIERLDQIDVLPRLTALDLSKGDLSREAEEELYARRELLSHLQLLKIHDGRIADWIHE
jgi:hypothetical protein